MITTESPETELRLFMSRIKVLLIEQNSLEREIVAQTLFGFKMKGVVRCETAEEGMSQFKQNASDLVITSVALGEMDGYQFTRWLRSLEHDVQRATPVLLLTAHTRSGDVARARNCGATWVIAKPITPAVLYQRITWLTKDNRPFIRSENYSGPDRRFQRLGPPPGMNGRRLDDLPLAVGEATDGNMTQEEIDALMKPRQS